MSKRDDEKGFFLFLFVIFIVGAFLFPIAAANKASDSYQPIWKKVLWGLAGLGVAAAIIGAAVYLFNMPR